MVVIDKIQKSALVIDITIPRARNVRKKEYEKLEKHKKRAERRTGENESKVIPVIINTLRTMTP